MTAATGAVDVKGNVASQQHRPIETVGAAIAGNFERRWQAADDMPLDASATP